MKTIGTLMVTALLATAPAAAQQHGHAQHGEKAAGQQGMAGMQHCAHMMGGMTPAMVLSHGDHLDLSAAQVERLEALRDERMAESQAHMQQAMGAQSAAAEMLQDDEPDFGAYEARLRTAADHMVQAHTAMARSAVATRDVLTEEQRESLAGMTARMQHGGMQDGAMQHGGMNHGAMQHGQQGGMHHGMGMMNCPMMGHGAAAPEAEAGSGHTSH